MNNKKQDICRICGAVKVKGSKPDFMASGRICVDCYYKIVEPNNPNWGINKKK